MIEFSSYTKQEGEKPKKLSRFQQLNNAITDSELSEEHKTQLREYVPILLGSTRFSYKGFSTMIDEFIRTIPDPQKTQRILTATANGYRNLIFASDYESIDTTKLNKAKSITVKKELNLSDEVF